MGITMYAMVYKVLPFWHDTIAGILDAIEQNPLEFQPGRDISPELRDMLSRLLDKSPESRIKMIDILVHPWITEGYDIALMKIQTIPETANLAEA